MYPHKYYIINDKLSKYSSFYYTTKNRLFTTNYINHPEIRPIFTVEINKIIPQK
jgi:hypothetical protein